MEAIQLKKEYTIGEEISFEFGWTGKVVEILHAGHKDIRPPYHRKVLPVLRGINGSYGQATIIPDNWEKYYDDEIHEKHVLI